MAYEDLPLRETKSTPTPPPSPDGGGQSSPARWVIVGALAVVVGALLALWWMTRAQPDTAAPPPTNATDVAISSNRPNRQPIDLPDLNASDAFLRDLVATLSKHPLLARLLATDGLVRTATLAVVQIGDGKTPAAPLQVLRPTSRLTIVGTDAGRVDPGSYARWDAATASLLSIDARDAAQLYVNVKPLFDEAYRALGHPQADFDPAIAQAIRVLAATPEVSVDPELLKRPAYYEHADPTLRALEPVQKQLLLTGPGNRRKIVGWLRDLAAALDLKVD